MKRNIFYYLTFGILLLFSCSDDFLNIAPETNLTDAAFFKTESHFNLALTGAYQPLRGLIEPGLFMDEMRSDNTFWRFYMPGRGPANWVEDIIQWTDHSQTTVVNNRYNYNYLGISRTNTIITRIEGTEFSDETKNSILGETYFLRAFYYFDLVTHYGGVPLYIEEVIDEESAYLSRSSVEEVYNQIISDLKNAIPKLPAVTSFPQSGRATKGAAKMLLAKAYMSKPSREYSLAETELREITNMNYKLLDDYADVFDPSNKNHRESIFEIQFKEGDGGQHSTFIYTMIPKTVDAFIFTGVHEPATSGNVRGWNVPNEEFINSYEEGDLRLPVSIKILEGTLNGGDPNYDYVVCLAIKDIGKYTPEPGLVYYPYVAKYIHGPYSRPSNTGENWPVFRYADVLLLLAECLVEQNKNDEALPFLNEVRQRAGLPILSEATKENVLNERRHELAFENHRWTDLIRTGKAIEVMTEYGEIMKSKFWHLPDNSFNVTEERLIYAIPFRETQINRSLTQNPGYY